MKRGVVVISKEAWSDTRWARKQWLAYYLAEHHDIDCVHYFNRHRAWWRGESKDVSGSKGKVTVQQEGLWFPGEQWAMCRDLNRRQIARKICSGLDDTHEWLALLYHPWDAAMIPRLSRRSLVMFDWTEDWTSFHDMRSLHEAQRQAVCHSDGVLTVSESLYHLAVEWRRSDQHVLLLPNGTPLEAGGTPEQNEELTSIPRPRIGFFGHVGPWFDLELVADLVQRNTDWQWIFVGGVEDSARRVLARWPSVHFLGVRPPTDLLGLMHQCDVLVAPYKHGIKGDASKLYDYLVSEKPIISAACDTAERLQPCVTVVKGSGAWEEAIADMLRNPVRMSQRGAVLARENHWRRRATALVQFWSKCANT